MHFMGYAHTEAFSLEKIKKSMDVLGKAYRGTLKRFNMSAIPPGVLANEGGLWSIVDFMKPGGLVN